jgi:hypothetical protein
MAIKLPPKCAPQLEGVRAKLLRAQDHFEDFDRRVEASLASESDGGTIPLTSKVDEDRHSITFGIPPSKPLDPALPLIIGDCVHNLRSALDHLVLQLALLKGTSITEAADKTSFPVCLLRKDFRSKTKRFVDLIKPEALTAIEDFQPYKTSDPPDTAFLWLLSELDIIDKHRLLVVVAKKIKMTEIAGTMGNAKRIVLDPQSDDWRAAEDSAELFTVEFSTGAPTKMHMELETAVAVQFANTGLVCDGGIVQYVINACGGFVEKIIDDLGHRFFGE